MQLRLHHTFKLLALALEFVGGGGSACSKRRRQAQDPSLHNAILEETHQHLSDRRIFSCMVALVNHDQGEVREAQVAFLIEGLPKDLRGADKHVRPPEGILPLFGSPSACSVACYLNNAVSPDISLIWRLEALGAHPLELLVRQRSACGHHESALLPRIPAHGLVDS